MEHKNWQCQNKEFEAGQFAATGGGLTKFSIFKIKDLPLLLARVASTPKSIKPIQVL